MRLTYADEQAISERVKKMSNEDLLETATSDTDEHDEHFDRHAFEVDVARIELQNRLRATGFLK